MNSVANTAPARLTNPAEQSTSSSGRRPVCAEAVSCYHCGETCADGSLARGDKAFCCAGCLTVHDLLAEAGLEHFYSLNSHPGVRIRAADGREKWAFLGDPELQARLLDFTNGKLSRITFSIPAIHCVSCVWLLENLFRLHSGIGRSAVNFTRREATIDFVSDRIKLSELAALLASIGYEPALTLGETDKPKPHSVRKRQWIQIGIAGFAFGNIMLFSLPSYFGMDSWSGGVFKDLFGYLSLAIALPVLIYSASDYWLSARLALRQRRLTLDVPIALGLAALFGQSAFEILSGRGAGYLDSLVGLIFFLLCGRAFQQQTHERLAFDHDFKSFFPLSVMRRIGIGREENVAISRLHVGDRVMLRNGELIPADARLVSGEAWIDYSFVTGESEPVGKTAGDYLYAGGKHTGAAIEVEVVKPVSESYLTSLWNHEVFRKDGRDNLNTLTNRYSRRFTLIVIAVAIGAALFWITTGDAWRGLKAFTSVLIVACPCALALAAPFTLGTAQRLLARAGVFIRNVLVLESLAQVNCIVFDKTGTLTAPDAGPVRFITGDSELKEQEADWVRALASQSTHPYSMRIAQQMRKRESLSAVDSFMEIPGCGVAGNVGGREILLGSKAWLEKRGVKVGRAGLPVGLDVSGLTGRSALPFADVALAASVHLGIGGCYRGAFLLPGTLRPGIERLLRDLGRQYQLELLSGDNDRERSQFGGMLPVASGLNFNQSPLDKLGFIRRLQDAGQKVMMVGDGLNDAGALKQSDVGVAVVEKIGVFSPASDLILEGAQVPRLDQIMTLARSSLRIVRLGFGLSALYNLIGVSIAAAGVLSPLICAVLMPLSSVSVVGFACIGTSWAARRIGLARTPRPEAEAGIVQPKLQPAC